MDAWVLKILGEVAPSSVDLVRTLVERKVKSQEVLIVLLAMEIEQGKRLAGVFDELRLLRSDLVRRGSV